ncbi:MAG: GNAT family N-acetyltransferase [Bacilli bacterium]|nr:GNAT family N-acetyltransferase [Bacilli bacterium]
MLIRRKELEDCERWIDIFTNSWIQCLNEVVSSRILNILLETKDYRLKKEKMEYLLHNEDYVLEHDSCVIGIMRLKKSNRDGFNDFGEIDTLYLDPNEMEKGYGKILFLKACEEFQKKKYSYFIVGCLNGNPSNLFYKHMGGEKVRQDSWDVLDEHYVENVYLFKI